MKTNTSKPTIWNYFRATIRFWAARAARHYGLISRSRRKFEDAVDAYGQAIRLNPAMARAYLERGILRWRELGQPEQALSDLDATLQLRPDWPETLFWRAMAHHAHGDYPAAIADLSAYLASGDLTWKDEAAKQLNLMQAMTPDRDAPRSALMAG